MKILFDPTKDSINQQKHGCSLALAEAFEWNEALIWHDTRLDYGEDRFTGIGYVDNRLYVIVFVMRYDAHRIISLRKANDREILKYAQT
jgi:hypothetical protein